MIDCHFHYDESMLTLEGHIESMDQAGIEKTALMAILCPPLEKTKILEIGGPVFKTLLASKNKTVLSIARSMYNGWVKDENTVEVGFRKYDLKIQPRNDDILSAVKKYPEKFLGWIFVNPAGPVDPVSEIERCISTPGMIGVKAHTYWHNYPVSMLSDAAALCEKKGLPIIIHLGTEKNGDFEVLPKKFPKLNVIYAHTGIPYNLEIAEFAKDNKNVYVDMSSPGYVSTRLARQFIRIAGAKNCLFGTDGPYFSTSNNGFCYDHALEVFNGMFLSEEEKNLVGKENFLSLINQQ